MKKEQFLEFLKDQKRKKYSDDLTLRHLKDGWEEIDNSEINLTKKELLDEMIKLSDDIESKYETPDIEEWKAFKHFRNKMRDKLTN